MAESSLALNELEAAALQELQSRITTNMTRVRDSDSSSRIGVRNHVLSLVVQGYYAKAQEELRFYVQQKSAFPLFQDEVAKTVDYCIDLINAIEAKRNFPGVSHLTLSKQQDIFDRVLSHFHELKHNLDAIEKIEREHKVSDVRSTVWVVSVLINSILAITMVGFVLEFYNGMGRSLLLVSNILMDRVANWVVLAMGL